MAFGNGMVQVLGHRADSRRCLLCGFEYLYSLVARLGSYIASDVIAREIIVAKEAKKKARANTCFFLFSLVC